MPVLAKPQKRPKRLRRTLRMRGDVAHTFGTLLAPLAIALVVLGFYLLASAFSHPLTTDSSLLLTASIVLSLGVVLLSYLLRSAMSTAGSQHSARSRSPAKSLPGSLAAVTRAEESAAPLSFHRVYVDSVRVRR